MIGVLDMNLARWTGRDVLICFIRLHACLQNDGMVMMLCLQCRPRDDLNTQNCSASDPKRAAHYMMLHLLCLHCSKYPSSSSFPNAIPCLLCTPLTVIFCSPAPWYHLNLWIKPPSMSSTLMVHLPLLTSTAVLSRGKWNSGRNISVGASSVAAVLQSSKNAKVAFRRSKPDEMTLPTVAIGLGRT